MRSPPWSRNDVFRKKGLEPREMGLVAAALSLVADQGFKLFMLYGGLAYAAGAGGARIAVF